MEDHGFRLPTEEEKQKYLAEDTTEFRLPTEEEKAKYTLGSVPESEPSLIKDLARLGIQGASMSFSDEVLAGLQAAADVAGTEKTLKDLPALYEQYKQIERRKIEEARERSPILGTAAEIGGAIIPSLFTGGTSLAVKGAARFLPALAESTSAAAAIGRGALTGAQYGGLAAAGAMESPILSEEGGKEILKGAALGGTLGGVTTGGVEAAKAAYKALSPEYRTVKLAGRAFQEAAEGRPSPTSTAGETLLQKEEQLVAKKTVDPFLSKKGEIEGVKTASGVRELQGQNIGRVTKEAAEKGLKIGHLPETQNSIKKLVAGFEKGVFDLNDKETDLLSRFIEEFNKNKGLINPDLANEVRRILPDIQTRLSDKLPIKQLEPISKLKGLLLKELEDPKNVPGFKEANRAYRKSMEIFDTLLEKKASDVSEIQKDSIEVVRDLIKKTEILGETGVRAREKLALIKENAKRAFNLDPETYKKVGINSIDEFFAQLEKQAELSSIRQGIGGVDRAPGALGKFTQLLNVAHPYQLARYAGSGVKKATDLAALAYKLPDAGVMKFADALSNQGISDSLVQGLRNAVASGNVRAKNAALFSLLQKKEVRAVLGEENIIEQEEALP